MKCQAWSTRMYCSGATRFLASISYVLTCTPCTPEDLNLWLHTLARFVYFLGIVLHFDLQAQFHILCSTSFLFLQETLKMHILTNSVDTLSQSHILAWLPKLGGGAIYKLQVFQQFLHECISFELLRLSKK